MSIPVFNIIFLFIEVMYIIFVDIAFAMKKLMLIKVLDISFTKNMMWMLPIDITFQGIINKTNVYIRKHKILKLHAHLQYPQSGHKYHSQHTSNKYQSAKSTSSIRITNIYQSAKQTSTNPQNQLLNNYMH